jgi:hypothetical protein
MGCGNTTVFHQGPARLFGDALPLDEPVPAVIACMIRLSSLFQKCRRHVCGLGVI